MLKYSKIIREYNKCTKNIEQALVDGDLKKLESLTKEQEELTEKLQTTTHLYIRVNVDEYHKITSILIDKKHNLSSIDTAKEVKKVKVLDYINAGDTSPKVGVKIDYKDGSYRSYYLPKSALSSVNTSSEGLQDINWQDEWGSYSAKVNVK